MCSDITIVDVAESVLADGWKAGLQLRSYQFWRVYFLIPWHNSPTVLVENLCIGLKKLDACGHDYPHRGVSVATELVLPRYWGSLIRKKGISINRRANRTIFISNINNIDGLTVRVHKTKSMDSWMLYLFMRCKRTREICTFLLIYQTWSRCKTKRNYTFSFSPTRVLSGSCLGRHRRRRNWDSDSRRRRHVAVVPEDVAFFSCKPDGCQHAGPALLSGDVNGTAAIVADVALPV